MSDVDINEQVTVNINKDGDHDKFAHYAHQDDIMEAFVNGIPIMALCGKIWLPTRDGAGFPLCKECKEIYAQLS